MSVLDGLVRRVDADRWLASRFAPARARRALTALYAFHHEIARVGESVSDPMLGEIRLTWWREALDEIRRRPASARRHDVVQELAAAFADTAAAPDPDGLAALVDSRGRDLDPAPFATADDLLAYVDATAGALAALAAGIAAGAPLDAATDAAARAAGRAWGLVGLVRAAPAALARGRVPLSEDLLRAAGFADPTAATLDDAAALARLAEAVRPHVDAALARARTQSAAPAAWPGYGYAALAPGYLRRVESRRDPEAWPRLARQLTLTAAAARGRI